MDRKGKDAAHRALLEYIQTCDQESCQGQDPDDCFFVADLDRIRQQYDTWQQNLDIAPYYAVKCNPDPNVIRYLASLSGNVGFDCASLHEIRLVLSLGIDASRIIFAAPVKSRPALIYAAQHGVNIMTFDNIDELHKIVEHHPKASLCLRIAARDIGCAIDLSLKYGASRAMTIELLETAHRLDLRVEGVAFHVGTGAKSGQSYARALSDCWWVIEQARRYQFDLKTVDVGGGFTNDNFADIAQVLRDSLSQERIRGLRIIAEPGRFFSESAFTLACKVVGRRTPSLGDANGKTPLTMLYLSDGVFGNFMNVLIEGLKPKASLHKSRRSKSTTADIHEYSLWGPTCDSTDKLSDSCTFDEEVEIDDWLLFPNMGGNALVGALIMRKDDLDNIASCTETPVNTMNSSRTTTGTGIPKDGVPANGTYLVVLLSESDLKDSELDLFGMPLLQTILKYRELQIRNQSRRPGTASRTIKFRGHAQHISLDRLDHITISFRPHNRTTLDYG
nr:ornithine decarboxylase [Quercus suber]POF00903.1 ornithine decarboxylase [Quercus suber]